jgi:hypothetical protein
VRELQQQVASGLAADVSDATVAPLKDRLERRRKKLETSQSEKFDIPGYEGILKVELGLRSWEVNNSIARRVQQIEKDEGLRTLYTAAGQLLRATESFWEVPEGGGDETPAELHSWLEVARYAGHTLPEDATPRTAMVALLQDTGIMFLWTSWVQWLSERGVEVDEEMMRDFSGTTSSRG